MEEGGDSQSESANQSLQSPPTVPQSLGNLSSLDITNDEELPTDPSNSSDTQEESELYILLVSHSKLPDLNLKQKDFRDLKPLFL